MAKSYCEKNTMVGTIRRNKTELPPALVTNMNRDLFSIKFAFTDTHALVSYCPKKRKNVLLMSTLHKDARVSTREDRKPEAILYYNENKGGDDNLDKVCYFLFFFYYLIVLYCNITIL